ncbi:myelin protein zero-like protein 3 [Anomaloglossus baeobatrachus]|uniref:myelin protein zero-like protein 3 n=1 Tax=Anomaloglossus baeobatrachus TaxID=238106 RepID=UPI003F5012E3
MRSFTTDGEDITALVNDTVTLPCTYSAGKEAIKVCWRRDNCSRPTCSSTILSTNGSQVTKRTSSRYQLLGNITWGDASLTITKLTMKDKGTFCCKVLIPGPSNDVKRGINLMVMETSDVMGFINETVMLPCTYSASKGVTTVCWGRGRCSTFRCPDSILRSNSSRVIRKSHRYEFLGKIPQGIASLTINRLTAEDEGTYCCKVILPGPSNDVKREINLQIMTNDEKHSWGTLGNVIRGIIVILVPAMVLLTYKRCDL